MPGNRFGQSLTMTSFGESHGEALGVVVDGVPPGLDFSCEALQEKLDRRAGGRHMGTTSRREPDQAEVLSGIFQGKTLGTPIAVIVRNKDQRSMDYDKLKNEYRPGHADQTTMQKYGIRDYRGGGRASGRETLARVIGGHIASLVIPTVCVRAYVNQLGPFVLGQKIPSNLDGDFGPYGWPEQSAWDTIADYLATLQRNGESCGGQISVVVSNCPAGLGEPVFDKLKADFAKALLSIGACVSYSFGSGEEMSALMGREVSAHVEHFGGMEGGISSGRKIFMRAAFKPTSTVGVHAQRGRHDPCIVPRAIPVVEAMVNFVLADHYLRQNAYL